MRSESAKLNLLVMRSESAKLNLLVTGGMRSESANLNLRPHRKGASRSSRPKSQATPQGRLKEFETEVSGHTARAPQGVRDRSLRPHRKGASRSSRPKYTTSRGAPLLVKGRLAMENFKQHLWEYKSNTSGYQSHGRPTISLGWADDPQQFHR
jgi:hypothetical protein